MMCQWCGQLKPIENRELMLCASCNGGRRHTGRAEMPDTLPPQKSKRQLAREYQQKKRNRLKENYK